MPRTLKVGILLLLPFLLRGAFPEFSTDQEQLALTQIPHLVKYVMNEEVAPHLSELAEFSIRLLQWTDTDRQSVLKVQKKVKDETYAQEWGANLDYSPLPLKGVIKLTSDAYWSLKSPRMLKIEINEGISAAQVPDRVDLMGSLETPVPFLYRNERNKKVRVAVESAGVGLQIRGARHELRAGQTLGFFASVVLDDREEHQVPSHIRLIVKAGQVSKEIVLPAHVWKSGRLKVRVLDETGRSTPARIYLTGADGKAYTPPNVLPRITNSDYGQLYGGEYFFYTEGAFQVELPAGQAALEVVKGLEYKPVRKDVLIPPAGEEEVIIQLERPFNMAERGWYSGDVHIHPNLFEARLITPRDTIRITKAEDLNVAHLLACNDESSFVNELDRFEGKPHALSEKNYILYWNEEMRNLRLYGHMAFLHLKDFVEPSYVGWPGTPRPYDYPPNYHQAVQAKGQNAVVTYVHPGLPSEYPVDIALGVADAIDVMCQGDEERNTADWYRLLNCGFKCPISAGTDSYLNIPYHLIAGAGRVYVRTGPQLTYRAWMKGYKEGRSFATNGPLLSFTVNGKQPGEELHWKEGQLGIKVEAEVVSHIPVESLELVVNGRAVASQRAVGDRKVIQLTENFEIADSCWIAARVRGKAHRLVPNDVAVYAHSSPVYCYLSERPIRSRADALYFVDQIDGLIRKVEEKGLFKDPEEKQKTTELFRKGQEIYRKISAEPETQARPTRIGPSPKAY